MSKSQNIHVIDLILKFVTCWLNQKALLQFLDTKGTKKRFSASPSLFKLKHFKIFGHVTNQKALLQFLVTKGTKKRFFASTSLFKLKHFKRAKSAAMRRLVPTIVPTCYLYFPPHKKTCGFFKSKQPCIFGIFGNNLDIFSQHRIPVNTQQTKWRKKPNW